MAGWGDDVDTAGEVGSRLRQWRLILGFSQSLVAARAGISRQTLARLEDGDGTVAAGTFFTVAGILGLTQPLIDAVEPLNTDLGRARAHLLGRERAPQRRQR